MVIFEVIGNAFKTIWQMIQLVAIFFALLISPPDEPPEMGPHMQNGKDLNDYYCVGQYWQESYIPNGESDSQTDSLLEIIFVEATDEYVKIFIRPTEGESFDFYLASWGWGRAVDGNGNEYSVYGAWAIIDFYTIPLDSNGMTLYLYYSFETDKPAQYIQGELTPHRNGYKLYLTPHE